MLLTPKLCKGPPQAEWLVFASTVPILTEREIKITIREAGDWTPMHLPTPTNQLIKWFNIRLMDFKDKVGYKQSEWATLKLCI